MKNRIAVLFLSLSAAFGALADIWYDSSTGYTWTYRIIGNTAVIYNSNSVAISPNPTGAVTIPSTLGGKPVTSISDSVFSGCSGLTSITIPDSVTSIGGYAFRNCSGLTSVTIPDSVTSIGSHAFYGCSGLTSVTIPDSVTSIEYGAFRNCGGLTSVTIPDSVTSIGYGAFYGCSGLTSVTIPDSVTSIGDFAFARCEGLTSVTIPNSVTSIGSSAFSGCSGLTSVHIADLAKWCEISFGNYSANPLYYAHDLYLNGVKVTDLTIPDSVTSVGNYAFYGCSGLTSVTIPDSVTNIGDSAFSGCSGLTSVTIPDSVTNIGGSAFYGCSGLTSVTIPDLVTSIGGSAFYGCSGLTSVTIPDSVTSIGDMAFDGCRGLTSVVIPDSVTSVGKYAFYNCSGLTSVTIPNSVTSIGSSAFSGCSGLTSVYLPNGYNGNTSIGTSAIVRYAPVQTLHLDAKGGSLDQSELSFNFGTDYGNLPTPVREGWFFEGWALTEDGRPAFEDQEPAQNCFPAITTESVTLFARWSSSRYLISFDANGGDGFMEDCIVGLEMTIDLPRCAFTKDGHFLLGWALTQNGEATLLDGDSTDDIVAAQGETVTLYAVWHEGTGGGNGLSVKYYDISSSGYSTWTQSEAAMTNYFVNRTPTIETNTLAFGETLQSGFQRNSSASSYFAEFPGLWLDYVSTNRYHGKYANSSQDYFAMLLQGNISISEAGEYQFAAGCDNSIVLYIDGVKVCSTSSWTSPSKGTISLSRGFHNLSIATYEDSGEQGMFVEWQRPGDTAWSPLPQSALFQSSPAYAIRFDANEGEGAMPKRVYARGDDVTLPTQVFARDGWTFVGWATEPNGPMLYADGETVEGGIDAANGETVTLYARWAQGTYAVRFNANGGEGTMADESFGIGIPAWLSSTAFARTGYDFAGWATSAGGEAAFADKALVTNLTETANATANLYAVWTPHPYEVRFNRGAGTGSMPNQQLTYGVSANLSANTFTRTGYTFAGWATEANGGKVYADGAKVLNLATDAGAVVNLYTTWTVNTYAVVFNANGGTGGNSGKQNYGTAIVAPTVTREWFNFMGWSPDVEATVPASNVTYTAQWKRYGDSISASKMGGKTMRALYPSDYSTMTTVVLEDGITELPEGFFDGCVNVTSVTLPSTLQEFGIDDLPAKIRASLTYDENGFMIYDGWILDYQNRGAEAVTIPEGVVGIGRGAFAAMFDLEAVSMPESLRCIASGAFEDCSWIQNLQFMSGLRYVGPVAFKGCSSLLGAAFSDGVRYIGTNVFEDCWQMRSVRIPSTVTNIGDRAFTGCTAIRGVTVPTHLKTMQELFPASYSQIETAEVAEGETTVMDDMFAGCVALRGGATQTDMSMIPNTVTNIGARAFLNCTSLTAFVVPDSVTELGVSAFRNCSALRNVTLSRSLTALPDYAFYGCSMLETMIVPASVNYLGERFFCGRTSPAEGPVIENALYYLCTNAPNYHVSAYAAIVGNMTTYVEQGSRSWDGRQGSRVLPQSWNGYPITYWTPNRFDATFDANGGRFDLADGSAYTWSEQQITDMPYALPSTEPVRPGWAFEGWWTEPAGGAEVRYTTLVTATRAHTLYAHWRSLGNGMTVTFNSNGGTVVPDFQDYVPGQTFGQFPVPTRRGYTFQGWWTESVNGILMTEATQVPAADMELFAHWKPITYYVRFHANGGAGADAEQPFVYDVQQALSTHTFTRAGFAFSGWATTPSGQVRYAENASVVNLEEVDGHVVDLYAVWSSVGYSVRFDANGGIGIMDNQTIAVGETQNLWPCVFVRSGYTFEGWALSPTDAANGIVAYSDGAAVKNLAFIITSKIIQISRSIKIIN